MQKLEQNWKVGLGMIATAIVILIAEYLPVQYSPIRFAYQMMVDEFSILWLFASLLIAIVVFLIASLLLYLLEAIYYHVKKELPLQLAFIVVGLEIGFGVLVPEIRIAFNWILQAQRISLTMPWQFEAWLLYILLQTTWVFCLYILFYVFFQFRKGSL